MLKFALPAVAAALACGMPAVAQSVVYPGQSGPVMVQQPSFYPQQNSHVVYPQQNSHVVYPQQNSHVVYPQQHPHVVYPQQHPHFPQGPIVTPSTISGINSQTGGLNTQNTQIDPSTFDPNRAASQFNGTQRYVNRPVYNQSGQIVGYQQGHVWNNSITGQEHGNLSTVTPNGLGGFNEQKTFRSVAPAPRR